jgi:hypothetical protein
LYFYYYLRENTLGIILKANKKNKTKSDFYHLIIHKFSTIL